MAAIFLLFVIFAIVALLIGKAGRRRLEEENAGYTGASPRKFNGLTIASAVMMLLATFFMFVAGIITLTGG